VYYIIKPVHITDKFLLISRQGHF